MLDEYTSRGWDKATGWPSGLRSSGRWGWTASLRILEKAQQAARQAAA